MAKLFNQILTSIDDFVWGVPLIVLILAVGVFLTIRVKGLQIRLLPRAIKELFVPKKVVTAEKYPVLQHCVLHCPQPSVQVTSLVLQPRW